MRRRITRTNTFRLMWIFLFLDLLLFTSIPLRQNVSARIRVDTLRRVHTVGFLAGRLNFQVLEYNKYKTTLITVLRFKYTKSSRILTPMWRDPLKIFWKDSHILLLLSLVTHKNNYFNVLNLYIWKLYYLSHMTWNHSGLFVPYI